MVKLNNKDKELERTKSSLRELKEKYEKSVKQIKTEYELITVYYYN